MRNIKIAALLFILLKFNAFSETYTLNQCINYAKNNNSNIKVTKLDSAISEKKVKELIGGGLPQIDFTGTLTDNLKIATQMMPAEMMGGESGNFIPIKMGVQYDLNGKLSLNQKLFDKSFWIGLDASKLNTKLSEQKISKQEEQTFYDITTEYFKIVVIQKQLKNLKEILSSSDSTLKSTRIKYLNGAVRKIDVDKIQVSYNSTKYKLEQSELNCKQYLNKLKYLIGMPLNQELNIIAISEMDIDSLYSNNIKKDTNSLNNRIDYQIQNTMISIQEADKDNNKASYLPTLSFFANYGLESMRNQLDFFSNSQSWYSNSSMGLTLKVPIFSGFSKEAKVEQSEINIAIEKENLKNLEESIKVDIVNYYLQFKNAFDNIQNEKDNLELAKSVYNNTQIEYTQGKGSSLELIQAESSLRETQNNYYSKLLDLYLAQLDLEKNKGTLINFINNIK
jgi:outer membrane protein